MSVYRTIGPLVSFLISIFDYALSINTNNMFSYFFVLLNVDMLIFCDFISATC